MTAGLPDIAALAGALCRDAAGWARGAAPDPDLWQHAARAGLFGIEVPQPSGGLGLRFADRLAACAALAAADFGFAMSVVNTHNVALRLSRSATPAVQALVLPGLLSGRVKGCTALTEPGAGSDAGALATRAEETAAGWRLSGEKTWIVNGRDAGVALVYARVEGRGIGAFLVDLHAPGVTRHACASVLPQATIGSGGFSLDAVAVPGDRLTLPPETAFRAILGELNAARILVAGMLCAMLRASLDEVRAFGLTRHSFGTPLAGHQDWRLGLARAATDLAAAQALVDLAAQGLGTDAAPLLAAQAKVQAQDACQRHMPRLLAAMGVAGLSPDCCTPRHLAALPLAALTDGTEAMLLERVARLSGIAPARKD